MTQNIRISKLLESLSIQENQRPTSSFSRRLKTVLLLTVFTIKEVLFVHGLFLYTLLRPSISNTPPPIKLKIGYWNKLQFKLIFILRFVAQDQFWGQQWYKRVHASILKNLQQGAALTMAIPTVTLEDISPREFWRKYVKTTTPVIIKGGAKHTEAYQSWTMEMLAERFGDVEVRVIDQKSSEPFAITLKEVIASKDTDRQLYVSFCSKLFSDNPSLFDEIDSSKFGTYMGRIPAKLIGAQLFLGLHRSTGTSTHCTTGYNLFFQLRGKKKWTFVHPDYLWLMYPMIDQGFSFCASFLKRQYDEHYLERYAPLQQYCPWHEAVLEPGDILLNPPWVWHTIDNLTEETVAVATRWFPFGIRHSNTFFELIRLFSAQVWKTRFYALSKHPEAPSVLDRKTNTLVRDQKNLVSLGKKSPLHPLEFDQWPEEDQF